MARETIDFGIDLGTTNSAIAVMDGMQPAVVRSREGSETTPSVVGMRSNGAIRVGLAARNLWERDPANVVREFKLAMGSTDQIYRFPATGAELRPEDLSAEVLKSLLGDVAHHRTEQPAAAVITVPAAFDLPQNRATKRAAELAGLSFSPLVQEPVAAALAYGLDALEEGAYWLVFDLGGGTFDAAVVQLRDGMIEVVNHGGDNQLGGKLIDWAIVEELLIPELSRGYALNDFRRGNPRWSSAIAQLKSAAEDAKIQLSVYESTDVLVDRFCEDERGQPVTLDFELTRDALAGAADPFVLRAVNICKRVLDEGRLSPADIDKVLLVGGSTLSPHVRDRLMDPVHGLGIPLDFSIDPLTVVARGAAVFAATQRVPEAAQKPRLDGHGCVIELHGDPTGADLEPPLAGKVQSNGSGDFRGYTIEFTNVESQPEWRSGRLPLHPDGGFATTLWAQRDVVNRFRIELHDGNGQLIPTTPDSYTYRVVVDIAGAPLTHSVGVALADQTMDPFFTKGTPLPTRPKRIVYSTSGAAEKGGAGYALRVQVVEGENRRHANRNVTIGTLEIQAADLHRDLPAGSEVEVTISIDESRLVEASAFIPLIDEEIDEVANLGRPKPDPERTRKLMDHELQRLALIQLNPMSATEPTVQNALRRIQEEHIVEDAQVALAAADGDSQAAETADSRLRDLMIALDEAEDALELPALLAQAREQLIATRTNVEQHGEVSDIPRLEVLERETESALVAAPPDAGVLERQIEQLVSLAVEVLQRHDWFWLQMFESCKLNQGTSLDPPLTQKLIEQGDGQIARQDYLGLRATTQQLVRLLPREIRDRMEGGIQR